MKNFPKTFDIVICPSVLWEYETEVTLAVLFSLLSFYILTIFVVQTIAEYIWDEILFIYDEIYIRIIRRLCMNKQTTE